MNKLKAALATTAYELLGRLPLPAARALGGALGELLYRLPSRARAVTLANLAQYRPEQSRAQRRALARQSLKETARTALEICCIWHQREVPVEARLTACVGEDLARTAVAEGRGLIIIAPHLGNWEVLGLFLPTLAPVVNLYQPPKLAALEPVFKRGREFSGASLVPTTARGVAALLKNLKGGGIAGILPDQNPIDAASGDFAPFLGRPAFTMTLIHNLLRRTGARALFAFAKRVPGGFELVFRAPPEDLYSADQQVSLRALNEGVEALISEAPAQYQWEYKRFKKRPDGMSDLYSD